LFLNKWREISMDFVQLSSGQKARVASRDGLTYAEAFKAINGRIPSNLQHSEILFKLKAKGVEDGYPGWAREFCGKPAIGKQFERGKDVVDADTRHVLPESFLKNAKGGDPYAPGIGIFVDPAGFEESARGTVVIPKSIVVVANIQTNGKLGKVDKETGLIVRANDDEMSKLEWASKGMLTYLPSTVLTPIIRGFPVDIRTVAASCSSSQNFETMELF
jgi:hypothetical protein